MTTAAVVGATSMLGTRLVATLRESGVDVLTVGRSASDRIFLDLADVATLKLPSDAHADVLFLCAASFEDDSSLGLRTNLQINTVGAARVLDLAHRLGATSIVNAGTAGSSMEHDPSSYSSYALTKSLGELVLGWGMQKRAGLFCSLRFSQLYDTEGVCCRHQLWFGRIVAYAASGRDIRMPKSHGVRNFIHIDDAARLMIVAAQRRAKGVLNVVNPESLSYEEIAGVAYSTFGRGGAAVVAHEKAPFRVVDFPGGGEARAALGTEPSISMVEGMTRILDAGTWAAFGPIDVT